MNNADSRRLVLGCIDVSNSKSGRILQHFSRSTRFIFLCIAQLFKFQKSVSKVCWNKMNLHPIFSLFAFHISIFFVGILRTIAEYHIFKIFRFSKTKFSINFSFHHKHVSMYLMHRSTNFLNISRNPRHNKAFSRY